MMSPAAQTVIDLITRRDHVTFVEIERALAPSMPTRGAYAWELGSYPNLILWADMSEEFIAVMEEVRESGLTTMVPTSALTYMIDGSMLRMPIAKKPPQGGYATEHWAPVCFRLKAKTTDTKSRGRKKNAPRP